MWITVYRSPWQIVRSRQPFGLIAGLVDTSWLTLGGLLLAFGLTPLVPAHRLANSDDSQQLVVLKNGEILPICYGDKDCPKPVGANQGEACLHLCGLFIGRSAGGEHESSSRQLETVHGVEMIVNCRHEGVRNSCYVDRLHFERIWEASLFSACAPDTLNLPQGKDRLFLGPKVAAPHLGQRPVPRANIARRFRGLEQLADEELTKNLALWCVSSLSGKTVRIESLENGKIASIQPLGCNLLKPELDWLKASVLPSLMHSDNEANYLHGAEATLQDLSRILPFDVCAADDFHDFVLRDRLVQRSQHRLTISWIAPPEFFTKLHGPHVLLDPDLGFQSGSARLACSIR